MNLKTETKTALIDLELISYSHAAKAESTGTGLQSLVEMGVRDQFKINEGGFGFCF